jgi:hypothetical protein
MFKTIAATILAAALLTADSKVRSTITAGGQTTESLVLTKGNRQRLEFGMEGVLIQQCDLKRTLHLDAKSKTYFVLPSLAPPPPSPDQTAGESTVNTTITDTGETKPWFGFTARRVKTRIETVPGAVSCQRQPTIIETDGWYIDLAGVQTSCSIAAGAAAESCADKVKVHQTGKAKLGFPVAYTITSTLDGKTDSITMDVTELDVKSVLDSALFDAPADFSDVNAKKPGSVRVAVAVPVDKTGQAAALPNTVFQSLKAAGLEPLAMPQGSSADVDTRARQANADFVLYAELAELKKPEKASPKGGKRFGSLVSKASGLVNQKEAWEARVDYRLFAVGSPAPLASASALGKTGGESFNVKGAMSLAANVGMMTMMSGGPMGMMMMMSRGGAMGSMMGGIGMGMPGIAGLNALNPSLGGMRMMGMASSMNMGGAMGFSQTTPNAAATPANPEAAKAWQGAVDEMTKAVTLQVKK